VVQHLIYHLSSPSEILMDLTTWLLLWVTIWALIGVVIAFHASDRGGSWTVWFFVILLLGVIGLLLYIAVGPEGEKLSADELKELRAKQWRLMVHGPSQEEIDEWKQLVEKEEEEKFDG